MYEEIYSTISMSDAVKILKNYYMKEYGKYNNLSIDFYLKYYDRSYTDEYGFNEEDKGYELYCEMNYIKVINDITLQGIIKKDTYEIRDDLYEELKRIYKDDEYEIYNFGFPKFKGPNIDLDSTIKLYFGKIKQKVKKN